MGTLGRPMITLLAGKNTLPIKGGGQDMSEAVIVALITGGLSLIGIIYSSNKTGQAMDSKLDKQQAVIETKMDELTREVREHNNFAKRVPVVEEQIKVINHRIEDLEGFHKPA